MKTWNVALSVLAFALVAASGIAATPAHGQVPQPQVQMALPDASVATPALTPTSAVATITAPAALAAQPVVWLTPELVTAIGAIFTALATYLSLLVRGLIKSKVQSDALKQITLRVNDAVFTAVKEVAQTIVDTARKAVGEGKLPEDVAKAAKDAAFQKALGYLGTDGLNLLGQVFGMTEPEAKFYVAGKVESAVRSLKKADEDPLAALAVG